jgi:hypothetical protein
MPFFALWTKGKKMGRRGQGKGMDKGWVWSMAAGDELKPP